MISRRQFTKIACGSATFALAKPAAASALPPVGKRGCCFTTGKSDAWRGRIDLLRPSWMYSWGPRRPEGLASEIDFTPMIWGAGTEEKRTRILAELKSQAAAGEIQHVLGFNEPDQKNQSNLTVERVIDLWPQLMEVGVPLIGPGCVHPDREWMNSFMKEVDRRDLRVDAIAVHSYGGPSVANLVHKLKSVHKAFGRPVWLTEFAVGDWMAKTPAANRHKPENIAAFMRDVLPALDELPFLERYAWYSAAQSSSPLGTSALIDDAGNLTPLGEIYASH